ncbi:MAG: hypothetical protein H6702_22915 [Myxococcales bacterium]|nr:hypothetical protein [Myxococcales bacterium]
MRWLLTLSICGLAGCAGAPPAASAGQHRVRLQVAQGAQVPTVVGDHVCHAEPPRDPRVRWVICAGPGGQALLRALRGAPGVLSAQAVPP